MIDFTGAIGMINNNSAALCMLYDFSKAYLAYESEEIGDESDDDYEKEVDHIIAFYVSLYIGKKIRKKTH